MHELIASPFLGSYVVVRPGRRNGARIPYPKYQELTKAIPGDMILLWFAGATRRAWELDLSGRPVTGTVLVRPESLFGYGHASYELNLGCNCDCEHCYLGLKKFEGLSWSDRDRLLHIMRDAGVLWLQLTGGEPMIDRLFTQVYTVAYDLGMMLTILSNGSRLSNPVAIGGTRSVDAALLVPIAILASSVQQSHPRCSQLSPPTPRSATPFVQAEKQSGYPCSLGLHKSIPGARPARAPRWRHRCTRSSLARFSPTTSSYGRMIDEP